MVTGDPQGGENTTKTILFAEKCIMFPNTPFEATFVGSKS